MTYNVFGGMLNPAPSICLSIWTREKCDRILHQCSLMCSGLCNWIVALLFCSTTFFWTLVLAQFLWKQFFCFVSWTFDVFNQLWSSRFRRDFIRTCFCAFGVLLLYICCVSWWHIILLTVAYDRFYIVMVIIRRFDWAQQARSGWPSNAFQRFDLRS